ncbi:MAG: lactoylglutathione lyase [Actinomycetia bacterium]|nr:lactoylglutathione lyase [Actinomycetes bacterium]
MALDVADLAAAIEFYEHLGLAPVDRPGSLGANGIWLGVGDAQLHLVERPDLDEVSSGSHVAFEVQDLEGTAAALRDLGIEVGDPFDIGAGLQAFLRDPSGNLVELNQPTG